MTLNSLGIALLFAIIGIALFTIAFIALGRYILPGNLWQKALTEKSTPAAIILAAIALALAWIIASTLH